VHRLELGHRRFGLLSWKPEDAVPGGPELRPRIPLRSTGFTGALRRGGRLRVDDAVRVAKRPQLLDDHFLLLVRDVHTFARGTEAVAFDGFRKDHRRLARVFDCRFVGCVHLIRIVAAAV